MILPPLVFACEKRADALAFLSDSSLATAVRTLTSRG